VTQITLSWTTSVREHHMAIVDTLDLPELLQEAVREGVDLDNCWQLIDANGVKQGDVPHEQAQAYQDALYQYISDSEGGGTNHGDEVDDRTLTEWEVHA
jgi:hypothetical protein